MQQISFWPAPPNLLAEWLEITPFLQGLVFHSWGLQTFLSPASTKTLYVVLLHKAQSSVFRPHNRKPKTKAIGESSTAKSWSTSYLKRWRCPRSISTYGINKTSPAPSPSCGWQVMTLMGVKYFWYLIFLHPWQASYSSYPPLPSRLVLFPASCSQKQKGNCVSYSISCVHVKIHIPWSILFFNSIFKKMTQSAAKTPGHSHTLVYTQIPTLLPESSSSTVSLQFTGEQGTDYYPWACAVCLS